MTVNKLTINGAFLVHNPVFTDLRGAFFTSWEESNLEKQQISFRPVSANHSYNNKAGTLRGMHYQHSPYQQAKLVTCITGKVYDVILDIRKESPTYKQWEAVELSAHSGESVYIPAGCAHGFMTLLDDTTLFYVIEGEYKPEAAGTVRWNDPAFGIQWTVNHPILSQKDQNAPDYTP